MIVKKSAAAFYAMVDENKTVEIPMEEYATHTMPRPNNAPIIFTQGLGPCIAVLVYDSRSKNFFFGHFPPEEIPDAIPPIDSEMVNKASAPGNLNVYLIGGWKSHTGSAQAKQLLLKYFKSRNVKVNTDLLLINDPIFTPANLFQSFLYPRLLHHFGRDRVQAHLTTSEGLIYSERRESKGEIELAIAQYTKEYCMLMKLGDSDYVSTHRLLSVLSIDGSESVHEHCYVINFYDSEKTVCCIAGFDINSGDVFTLPYSGLTEDFERGLIRAVKEGDNEELVFLLTKVDKKSTAVANALKLAETQGNNAAITLLKNVLAPAPPPTPALAAAP